VIWNWGFNGPLTASVSGLLRATFMLGMDGNGVAGENISNYFKDLTNSCLMSGSHTRQGRGVRTSFSNSANLMLYFSDPKTPNFCLGINA
jgi:hypothetical protein